MNEYAENPPQIGEEGLEYNVSCQGLNRLKHPQKIQRRREMQFEHFTCMLIKHPEKSNADAKFVLTKSSVLLKLYTKLRSFFSFRPKAQEKSNAKCILTCRNPDSSEFLVVLI